MNRRLFAVNIVLMSCHYYIGWRNGIPGKAPGSPLKTGFV